jgi:hypothetical protein
VFSGGEKLVKLQVNSSLLDDAKLARRKSFALGVEILPCRFDLNYLGLAECDLLGIGGEKEIDLR